MIPKSQMIVNGNKIGPGANLTWANLQGADLPGADLRNANLIKAHLRGANLAGANLGGACLYEATLYRTVLTDANLRAADLRGADLRAADLRGASLAFANLTGADLTGADLEGADLTGADLTGADLTSAIIRKAPPSELSVFLEKINFPFGADIPHDFTSDAVAPRIEEIEALAIRLSGLPKKATPGDTVANILDRRPEHTPEIMDAVVELLDELGGPDDR
jgi:hypothetical protein